MVKKYLDITGLTRYDEKIKEYIVAKDAETLASSKSYADGLADNYDAAGSAATALEEAKNYADGKDAAIAAAKKAGEDAAAAAAVADGKAVTAQAAAEAAQAAANAAQADVDALETYVGTIPADATATDIVGYINEKTSSVASDAALAELDGRVTQAEKDIDTIEADYLKTADKTELQGNIDAVDDRVDVLVGTDTGKSVRKIANEELVAQLIPEAAKESLDTLQEIAAWIQSHPDDASTMNAAIEALTGRVTTAEGDIDDIQTLVGDTAVATQIQNAITALNLDGKYDAKGSAAAVQSDLDTYKASNDAAVAAAKKAGDDAQSTIDAYKVSNDARVQAVEDAINGAETFEPLADTDIDALFA